eukprot:14601103-Alexandrium_andersonii.AAC.1
MEVAPASFNEAVGASTPHPLIGWVSPQAKATVCDRPLWPLVRQPQRNSKVSPPPGLAGPRPELVQ